MPPHRIALVVGGAFAIAEVMLPAGTAMSVVGPTAMTLATLAIVVGIRRFRPPRDLGWHLIASAIGAILLGGIAEQALAPLGAPSLQIGLGLAVAGLGFGLPAGLVAVARLMRSQKVRRGRDASLDALIVALATGYLAWEFVFESRLRAISVEAVFGLLQLVAVVLLLVFILRPLLDRSSPSWSVSFRYLVAVSVFGAASMLIATSSMVLPNFHPRVPGLASLCMGFLAAAALHPSMRAPATPVTRSREPQPLSVRRKVLLGVALVVVPAAGLHHPEASLAHLLGTTVVQAVLAALVMSRIYYAVRDREAARGALSESEERFRSLVHHAHEGVAVVNPDGTCRYSSPAAARLLGVPAPDLVGSDLFASVHEHDRAKARAALDDAVESSQPCRVELRVGGGPTGPFWLEAQVTDQLQVPGVGGLVVNLRDVSERKAFEAQLTFQAFHDPLTGLANRALFDDRLVHALAHTERSPCPLAVLLVDLDGFKTINDSLGHVAGDLLLIEVAERLRQCVRPSDTLARLGGDEFAVVLERTSDAGASLVAERILEAIGRPFVVQGRELDVSATIGLTVREESCHDAGSSGPKAVTPTSRGGGASSGPKAVTPTSRGGGADLLRDADVAMYVGKEKGRNTYVRFEPSMHDAIVERVELAADLRVALDRGQLEVVYQPIVDLPSGATVACEALLRWHHPVRGSVSPATFIPLAEDTGAIVEIGRWVLLQACRQLRVWDEEHPGGLPSGVSVNVSVRQLQDPRFAAETRRTLAETGIEPGRLTLEITESALLRDPDRAAMQLHELKRDGIRIAVDDFGTGYSSIAYLQRFPIDTMKIDRAFIRDVAGPSDEGGLARAMVGLARSLGLTVVAEGIERAEQAVALTELGCPLGQGFLLGRPGAAAGLAARIAEESPVHVA